MTFAIDNTQKGKLFPFHAFMSWALHLNRHQIFRSTRSIPDEVALINF